MHEIGFLQYSWLCKFIAFKRSWFNNTNSQKYHLVLAVTCLYRSQIDEFVFKTILMWLQEDNAFSTLSLETTTETADSQGKAAGVKPAAVGLTSATAGVEPVAVARTTTRGGVTR